MVLWNLAVISLHNEAIILDGSWAALAGIFVLPFNFQNRNSDYFAMMPFNDIYV